MHNILYAVVFLLGSVAAPGKQEQARAVLEKAAAALLSVRTFHYTFHYDGEGSLQGHFSGQVWGRRGETASDHAYHVRMTDHGDKLAEPPNTLWMTNHGSRADHVDFATKTHASGTLGKGNAHLISYMYYAVWFQFTQARPFMAELAQGNLSVLPEREVAGELCRGIRIELPNSPFGDLEHAWYFSKKDHLPRAQVWKNRAKGQEGVFHFQVSGLAVNEMIPQERFRQERLPGFKHVDEDERAIAVGSSAPDWTLPKHGGGQLSLSDYRGKIVILDFWATWCPPCGRLMPKLEALYEEYKDKGVALVGINTWESDRADINRYLKRHGITYPVATDGERLAQTYKIGTLPALFAVDHEGKFLYISNFLVNQDPIPQLRQRIEEALKE